MIEFIQRCVTNIQESPESMHAGLSSLLLKTIAITSQPLQEMVARDVYLPIVDQVVSRHVKMVNQVAYLTVLISLTQTVADSKSIGQQLAHLTLLDRQNCSKLEQIMEILLASPQVEGQIETVRYEKLLYLYCALKDLQSKCEEAGLNSTFGVESDLDQRLLTSISGTLAQKIIANDQSTVSKICFAALARETKRKPQQVSQILHASYLSTGSKLEVIKAFFSGDLMGDAASV